MSHHMQSSWTRLFALAGALLVAVALLAGCGRTIAPITQTLPKRSIPTPAPTYTPAPASPLNWQTRALPTALGYPSPGLTNFALAPSGAAWMCAPDGTGAQVWVSHDAAQHWQHVSDVTASGPADACSVVADEVDPATAVVEVAQQQKGCCVLPAIPYPLVATHDGGKTWTPLHGPLPEMSELASYHGVSYAVFHGIFADATPGVFAFAASSDGLRTWRRIDGALADSVSDPDARGVRDIWVNPATGEMLIHTQTSAIWTDKFLVSDDGGASWRDLHAPVADQFVVRAPYAAGPWEICGLRTSSSSMQPAWPAPLICTLDSGKTWASRDGVAGQDNDTFALANDGEALAGEPSVVYRSSPGKSAWVSLGGTPASASSAYSYAYQPNAGSGLIWALPEPSTASAPLTQVYVARYA